MALTPYALGIHLLILESASKRFTEVNLAIAPVFMSGPCIHFSATSEGKHSHKKINRYVKPQRQTHISHIQKIRVKEKTNQIKVKQLIHLFIWKLTRQQPSSYGLSALILTQKAFFMINLALDK